MKTINTIAVLALFAGLAACSYTDSKGREFTGRDPVTNVSASLNDINRCADKGGVKNTNPIASLGGGFYPADCVK